MNLQEYVRTKYNGNTNWFTDEVKQSHHLKRISGIMSNKRFLDGTNHDVLTRPDYVYKGDTLKTSKIILHTVKSIVLFHNSYIMGKKVSLVGSENKVQAYNRIYRSGKYPILDYKIVDHLNKYGNAYEYIYTENKTIKSKLINPEDGYPVYTPDGSYVAFIEHFRNNEEEHYIIYGESFVKEYKKTNDKVIHLFTKNNFSGLPIHYINGNNDIENKFGKSIIDDIKPLIEKIEMLLSKLDDAIYVNSLNPIAYTTNLQTRSINDGEKMNADLIGHMLELEDGEFKYAIAMLDYQSIKFLYDSLMQQLLMVACVPYHIMGQGNISNVSEVSLKLLFQTLQNKSDLLEIHLVEGFNRRFDIIDQLLILNDIHFDMDDYVDVEFNYSKPINNKELLENLKMQYEMGAISKQTIIEKSELTNDVIQEQGRIQSEGRENKNDSVE